MKHVEKIMLQPENLTSNDSKLTLSIPENIASKWKLTDSQFPLRCGVLEVTVTIKVYRTSSSHTVYCSPELLRSLSLPTQTIPITISYCKQQKFLSFGPIFCLALNCSPKAEIPFGSYTDFCREVAEYCEEHHILFYVYTLQPWNETRVSGFIWTQRTWMEMDLPIPSVIYNRIHSRKLENSPFIQQLKTYWQQQKIPYFNESFLDKWDVHQKLLSYEEITPYLPETVLLEGFETVEIMIMKHPILYLKPLNGSQGKHIFRITQRENLFLLDYSSFHGNQTLSSSALTSLFKTIRLRSKYVPYLIQQGIPLIDIDGCPVDFRILCVKGSGNKWSVVSAVSRVSRTNEQFVSNIARGALLKKFDEGLTPFEDSMKRQLKRILPELAREVSQIIDRESEGLFGELGIDMSVDQNGHPWIIEVNTKPSKTSEGTPSATYRPSVRALIRLVHWYASL
ncbi:YheC/YheD family protein [Guptibacillus spartinae]|uniref:YheC/YheD family endospore coat-associated protein n=1 Tax=Guptibacillus spartinae TaxID=3025679 RepID=UPI002362A74A|nr:YheC/YheD family protein [Pseudalkalibacillus spartinae]